MNVSGLLYNEDLKIQILAENGSLHSPNSLINFYKKRSTTAVEPLQFWSQRVGYQKRKTTALPSALKKFAQFIYPFLSYSRFHGLMN